MVNLILFFILIFSFLGMIFIFLRNFPTISFELKKEGFLEIWKRRLERMNPFKNFSFEIFLQKIIAKVRILSLKIDAITFNWLKKLREKHQRKKSQKKKDYWEEIKKAKEEKLNKPA